MNSNQSHREVNRLNVQRDIAKIAINFHLNAVVADPEESAFQDALVEWAEVQPITVLRAIDEHAHSAFLQEQLMYIVEFAIGRARMIPTPRVIPVREVR